MGLQKVRAPRNVSNAEPQVGPSVRGCLCSDPFRSLAFDDIILSKIHELLLLMI